MQDGAMPQSRQIDFTGWNTWKCFDRLAAKKKANNSACINGKNTIDTGAFFACFAAALLSKATEEKTGQLKTGAL